MSTSKYEVSFSLDYLTLKMEALLSTPPVSAEVFLYDVRTAYSCGLDTQFFSLYRIFLF
jgi:hypothetical protein